MGLLDQTGQEYYQGGEFGGYQFISLTEVINQFMLVYVGEDKIIPKVKRLDVAFHAQRALQELSFDTFKSTRAHEITLPPSLQMILPQDYVNYTKVSWVDSGGIKHLLYPASKTSNPTNPLQDTDGDFVLNAIGTLVDTSDEIVLDGEYGNIQVGMIVSAPNISLYSSVIATSNASGITTIQISNDVTYTGTETLVFTPADDSLILEEQSTFILENVTWAASEDKITQAPNTDVSNITVGMLVSHDEFEVGTTVIDVNGAVITTSTKSFAASTATTNEVTFISTPGDSDTWSNYKSANPNQPHHHHHHDHHDHHDHTFNNRYGLDPQHAQANGSFYIDNTTGKIHFSSNLSGKTVILDYISDGLAQQITPIIPRRIEGNMGEITYDTNGFEPLIHKFAEEAMYKWLSHAILAGKANVPEYQVNRFKKERFAAVRTAKLRLSNIKLEEITQILRGKSKQIKH
tara:strand:- start:10039 stop:11421 length:1383 start_codon:yes stop_codon:yes gene_type:complete